jgi:hypothetical protein
MNTYVTTDHSIDGGERLTRMAEAAVSTGLARVAARLTRVNVHLADESAGRETPGDQRCTIEGCPASQPPVAVTMHADTLEAALIGAIHKLDRLLQSKFDRLDAREAHGSIRGRHRP